MRKIPVSERALVARINRALAKDGEVLRRCREDSPWFADLGRYYTLNLSRNFITGKYYDDLEVLGREVGVLQPYEKLGE